MIILAVALAYVYYQFKCILHNFQSQLHTTNLLRFYLSYATQLFSFLAVSTRELPNKFSQCTKRESVCVCFRVRLCDCDCASRCLHGLCLHSATVWVCLGVCMCASVCVCASVCLCVCVSQLAKVRCCWPPMAQVS